jgi:Flp pilus assembly protein TadG
MMRQSPKPGEISMQHPGKRLVRLVRNRSGAAAIEFALIGATLAMAAVVTADLGMGFYSFMQVQTSAQVGAEYAIAHGFNATAMASAVTAATPASGISASPAPTSFCGCPSTTGVTATTCGTTCADSSAAGDYVTVTATRTYTPIIPYPMLPASFTQRSVSTVRIH